MRGLEYAGHAEIWPGVREYGACRCAGAVRDWFGAWWVPCVTGAMRDGCDAWRERCVAGAMRVRLATRPFWFKTKTKGKFCIFLATRKKAWDSGKQLSAEAGPTECSLRSSAGQERGRLEHRTHMGDFTHEALPKLELKQIRCQDKSGCPESVLLIIERFSPTRDALSTGPSFVSIPRPYKQIYFSSSRAHCGDRVSAEHQVHRRK